MQSITLIATGAYTLFNLIDVKYEHDRLNSRNLHIKLDKNQSIQLAVKMTFIFLSSFYLIGIVLTNLNIQILVKYTLVAIISASIPWKSVGTRVNQFSNQLFQNQKIKQENIENTTIQWASSPQKEERQLLTLAQIITNVTICVFNSFYGMFLINSVICLVSYAFTTKQKDLKVVYIRDLSKNEGDGPKKITYEYFFTCLPSSSHTPLNCLGCKNKKPDTVYCNNNHMFHLNCLVKHLQQSIASFFHFSSFSRTLKMSLEEGSEFATYLVKFFRNILDPCPDCRTNSPFSTVRVLVDDLFENKTSVIPAQIEYNEL